MLVQLNHRANTRVAGRLRLHSILAAGRVNSEVPSASTATPSVARLFRPALRASALFTGRGGAFSRSPGAEDPSCKLVHFRAAHSKPWLCGSCNRQEILLLDEATFLP